MAKPSPVPLNLVVKKGSKTLRLLFFRDPGPVVLHGQDQTAVGKWAGLDDDLSATFHRFCGVLHQVDENLSQLGLVDPGLHVAVGQLFSELMF